MVNEDLQYTLICDDGSKLFYKPHTSELIDSSGMNVYEKNPVQISKVNDFYVETPKDYKHRHLANLIHPFFNPGKKVKEVGRLKIQLGLKCNYSCEYCSQASFVPDASISTDDDVDIFLEKLEKNLNLEDCGLVELWGGEPLLYWKKIKKIVPYIYNINPSVEFSIVTNGSLINQEKIDFFKKYKFSVTMSHDGPGYHLRGPDPLDNKRKFKFIEQLIELNKKDELGFSFSIVWTKENNNFEETIKWFQDKFNNPNVPISAEGVVEAYDINTATNEKTGKFDYSFLQTFEDRVYDGLVDGTKPLTNVFSSVDKINEFFGTLIYKKHGNTVGQKCGMENEDDIAIDLKGNVLTCQNVGLEKNHYAGDVEDLEEVRVKSSRHWSWREECSHCPVLQLCQGSCMFLTGKEFAQTCWNEYAYNMGHFKAAITYLTGKRVVDIEGDVRRPSLDG